MNLATFPPTATHRGLWGLVMVRVCIIRTNCGRKITIRSRQEYVQLMKIGIDELWSKYNKRSTTHRETRILHSCIAYSNIPSHHIYSLSTYQREISVVTLWTLQISIWKSIDHSVMCTQHFDWLLFASLSSAYIEWRRRIHRCWCFFPSFELLNVRFWNLVNYDLPSSHLHRIKSVCGTEY